jgi:hypothetical protein
MSSDAGCPGLEATLFLRRRIGVDAAECEVYEKGSGVAFQRLVVIGFKNPGVRFHDDFQFAPVILMHCNNSYCCLRLNSLHLINCNTNASTDFQDPKASLFSPASQGDG